MGGSEPRPKSEVRALPRTFGPYLLLEELATGGMARVFRAWRLPDGPHCAVKQLLGRHAEKPAVIRRFSREALVSSMLDHPNVAKVLDAGLDEGAAWIAMELVDGRTIADLIRRSLELREWIPHSIVAGILLSMCEGLDYVHDARSPSGEALELVHRDLSPRNVMVGFDGIVKIIDFGVARAEVGDFQTKPGHLLGSLRYLSPEQAMGMAVDRRSDLYTLGVIAYELFTMQPYVKDDHPLRVLRAIVQRPLRPESELEHVAPPIRAVVRRALAKSVEERFQTAGEMRSALRAALGAIAPASKADLAAFMASAFARPDPETAEATAVTRSESIAESVFASASSSWASVEASEEVSEEAAEDAPDLDEPTEAGRTALRDTVLKVKVRRPRSRAPIVLAAIAVLAGGAALWLRSAPSANNSETTAPIESAVVPVAKARPEAEDLAESTVSEESPKPAKAPRKATKASPLVIEEPAQPAKYAALHRSIAEAEADAGRFDAAYDAIRSVAERDALDPTLRTRVFAALNAARLAGSTAGLTQALTLLESSR